MAECTCRNMSPLHCIYILIHYQEETRHFEPMLACCWSSVVGVGPTLTCSKFLAYHASVCRSI